MCILGELAIWLAGELWARPLAARAARTSEDFDAVVRLHEICAWRPNNYA